ncbi:MAG: YggS family pyridoxal phosphate-dependent enzyme [Clostridia bacterium]|nr:YggS family pyridoxal phosphate-dependent enzyme [Clostridia bacterium]
MMEKLSIDIFNDNYKEITQNIARAAEKSGRKYEDITLLAATKTVDVEVINHAIEAGVSFIGENRVQEFLSKYEQYNPVNMHFIGHLQTNKVKDIIDKVSLIHSVDSYRLAEEISRQAVKRNIIVNILLEINIGDEQSKSGFEYDEAVAAVEKIAKLGGIKIKGLMAIPPICATSDENRPYFAKMKKLFIDIGSKKIDNSSMDILSMGMSDDYQVAIEEGATMVRLGTALFGRRNYNI